MDNIKLRAPATVANLSCGFDILGLCLKTPYDEIEINKISSKKIIINSEKSEFSNIPTNPNENTGGVPAQLIQSDLSLDFGFEINIKKGIPLCGGLGSSAATAAGVVFGINKILNDKLNLNEMIRYALEGEKISSESPHADNIGPCLMGGLIIIRNMESLDLIKIPTSNFYCSVIHPDVKIDTKTARKILPKQIDLSTAINQWGNISALTYGFASMDIDLIKRSMDDYIIEPVRSKLIPCYSAIKKAALSKGAIGCSISGSGPSIFALCSDELTSKIVVKSMEEELKKEEIYYHSYISEINNQGITVLD